MINIIQRLIKNKSITSSVIKLIMKKLFQKYFKSSTIVKLNIAERPNYAYCMYYSAILAKKLNYKSISFIEFGVAGGNGLNFIENFSNKISNELNIKIKIYGFTSKDGMPKPKGYADLPYWFKENIYKTDKKILNKKLKKSIVIYGDVKNTIKKFFQVYKPYPIAAIFNDLDYYSSTLDSFKIFNFSSKFYLPRIFCYFDDIIGTENEMYSEHTGELLAIQKFNENNKHKKISLNRNLISSSTEDYRFQIYHFHNFKHPKYNTFISDDEQNLIDSNLKLNK